MASVTSIVKTSEFILKSPVLSKIFVPLSNTFCELSGYRKLGLKFEDLLIEETPVMQKALSRLPEDESYARAYRILTAHQMALSHHLLPKDKQIKVEDDKPYLLPYILEAEAEAKEKKELDNIVVVSSK